MNAGPDAAYTNSIVSGRWYILPDTAVSQDEYAAASSRLTKITGKSSLPGGIVLFFQCNGGWYPVASMNFLYSALVTVWSQISNSSTKTFLFLQMNCFEGIV